MCVLRPVSEWLSVRLFGVQQTTPTRAASTLSVPHSNLLHTLRSIALKFKCHALAKHFNQQQLLPLTRQPAPAPKTPNQHTHPRAPHTLLAVRSETKTNAIAIARIPQPAMSLSLELFGQFALYTHPSLSLSLSGYLALSLSQCVWALLL